MAERLLGLSEYFGLKRNLAVLLAVTFLLGMGEELWTRFMPKYIELLGAGVLIVGLYGTLKDVLDAFYQYPGGIISDRLGHRKALVVFNILAIFGYVTYLLSGSWPMVFVGTLFVAAWSSLSLPATFSIVGDSLPQSKRAIGFATQSIIRRIPIIIAPPLGGLLLARAGFGPGMKVGFAVTIVLAVIAVFVQRRFYTKADAPPKQPAPVVRESLSDQVKCMDPRLKRLLVADILARFAEGIPKAFIVLYVLNIAGASTEGFGLLTSLSMAVSVAVYIPIAKLADASRNKNQYVTLTFIFFALFPLVLALSRSVPMLALAFIVMGLREIAEPARKAMIVDLSRAHCAGRDVGTYYSLRQIAVMPASLIGGLLWRVSPQTPFYVAFVVGVIGAAVFAILSAGQRRNSGETGCTG